MKPYNLATVFACLPALSTAFIIVTNLNNTNYFHAHTMDYFQHNTPLFTRAMCVLTPIIGDYQQQGCTFLPATRSNLDAANLKRFNCTVGYLPWGQARTAGCRNIAEASKGVYNTWTPTLHEVGLPENVRSTLVIGLPWMVPGEAGGPATSPYLSHSFTAPDLGPYMETMLISYEDASMLMGRFGLWPKDLMVNVVQEHSPWNDLYLSNGYYAYIWSLFGASLIICVMASLKYGSAKRMGLIKTVDVYQPEQPGVVFFCALVSGALCTIALAWRRQTQTFFLLNYLSLFFYSLAFYTLLLLWGHLMAREPAFRNTLNFVPFRIAVFAALLVALVNLVFGILWLSIWPGDFLSSAHVAFRYILPITQAAVFAIFLIYFAKWLLWRKRTSIRTLNPRQQAFQKLSWLAVIGFIAQLVQSLSVIISADPVVASSVAGLTTVYIVTDVTNVIRTVALFLILSLCDRDEVFAVTLEASRRKPRGSFSKGGWMRMVDEDEDAAEMEAQQEMSIREFENLDPEEQRQRREAQPKRVYVDEEEEERTFHSGRRQANAPANEVNLMAFD
jgi:heme exporter protein D